MKEGVKIFTLFTVALSVIDILFGTLYAIIKKTYKSCIMRDGLKHKIGNILAIILGYAIDYGQHFTDLGFNIPVLTGILTYIAIMEIGSIYETVQKFNPNLKFKLYCEKESDK